MKREFVFFALALLVVFSIGVYAAGSSTGNPDSVIDSDDDASNVADSAPAANDVASERATRKAAHVRRKTAIKEQYSDVGCENVDSRKERIKCRLAEGEGYGAPSGNIPEACRLSDNSGKCVALYSSLKNCYDLEGKTKDKCFKRAIGLRKARLSDVAPDERPQKVRDYVIALLYDLQEKVEKFVDADKVDPDDAADIVDKIVEIKGLILNGEGRDIVKPAMQDLRSLWRSTSIENE